MNQEQYPHSEELIPVVYARDLAEANYYKSLLDDHEILVLINEEAVLDDSDEEKCGIPVLVPDEHLAEAQDILEQCTSEEDDFDEEEEDYEEEKDELVGFQEEDSDLENY